MEKPILFIILNQIFFIATETMTLSTVAPIVSTRYRNSLILTTKEAIVLNQMMPHSNENLLYRGSRDGFNASAFRSRCDGQANTITIIKSNFNHVFGGFTTVQWNSLGAYSTDQNAFIFSLRRSNSSNFYAKFPVRESSTAIWNRSYQGPAFGSYSGLYMCDILIGYNNGNYADFGASYTLPQGYSYGSSNTRSFLAGSYSSWSVIEMEVYKLNSVQINH
jgi:hypothetical protein